MLTNYNISSNIIDVKNKQHKEQENKTMKKNTIVNLTKLKATLKGNVMLERKDGYTYVADGHYILKVPNFYYDENIRPFTNYFFNGDESVRRYNALSEYTPSDSFKLDEYYFNNMPQDFDIAETTKFTCELTSDIVCRIVKTKKDFVFLNEKYTSILNTTETVYGGGKREYVLFSANKDNDIALIVLPVNYVMDLKEYFTIG